MKPDLVTPSPLWQALFVSFAVVLVSLEIARGWRLGLPRQLVRIAAVVAAYSAAVFGGRLLLPMLRPLLKIPDFLISMVGGAILGLIVYSVITSVGRILFKRTGQQECRTIRLIYGAAGGILGLFFGAFLLWVMVVGVRSLGAVAEARVNAMAPTNLPRFEEGPARSAAPTRGAVSAVADENSLVMSLARLKKSVELGAVGDVVKQTDVLPTAVYDTLAKAGGVFAQPERARRFMAYPGVQELADSPKILALRADPEIAHMISEGRLIDLLHDERLIEAANDPELAAQLKRFDFSGALEYAARDR